MRTLQKLAILESLDTMDQIQMEKVLHYIREVLHDTQTRTINLHRQQAMEQIRKALRADKERSGLAA